MKLILTNQKEIEEYLKFKYGMYPVPTESTCKFPVWKTITLRNRRGSEYMEELERKDFKLSMWAKDILSKIKPVYGKINLALVTPKDLGLTGLSTRKQIYDAAIAQGLRLAPACVGPELRLRYEDQPYGERVLVGMEPIVDSRGVPRMFLVNLGDDDRWLYAACGRPDCQLVFEVPSKQ